MFPTSAQLIPGRQPSFQKAFFVFSKRRENRKCFFMVYRSYRRFTNWFSLGSLLFDIFFFEILHIRLAIAAAKGCVGNTPAFAEQHSMQGGWIRVHLQVIGVNVYGN